jgi:hypothetical protein
VYYPLRFCGLLLAGALAFTAPSYAQSDQLGSPGDELDLSSTAKNPAKPGDFNGRFPTAQPSAPASAPAKDAPARLPEGSFYYDKREKRCDGSRRDCGLSDTRGRDR